MSAEDTFPTAAEIAAMNDLERKTLENRLRRRAARQGSKLERCTDAGDPAYGTYMVTSAYTNDIETYALPNGYGLTLRDVATRLSVSRACHN